ncbi:hypothetical protein STEG23_033418 [Scotinomys teguina]
MPKAGGRAGPEVIRAGELSLPFSGSTLESGPYTLQGLHSRADPEDVDVPFETLCGPPYSHLVSFLAQVVITGEVADACPPNRDLMTFLLKLESFIAPRYTHKHLNR